jgi:hypothetical protein
MTAFPRIQVKRNHSAAGQADPDSDRKTQPPRAAFAVRVRDPLRLMGYAARCRLALAVVSRGVAGLTELSAGGGGRSYPHADEKGESGGACAT